MKKYKIFKDRKQVFDELLGKNGKAFFKNESSSIKEIIETIHESRGVAVLAHPAYLFENASKVIEEFIKMGGDCLEVECPYDSFREDAQNLRNEFRKIAEKNNLIVSGGTDFHEKKDGLSIGSFGLTDLEFEKLKTYAKNRS